MQKNEKKLNINNKQKRHLEETDYTGEKKKFQTCEQTCIHYLYFQRLKKNLPIWSNNMQYVYLYITYMWNIQRPNKEHLEITNMIIK